MLGRDLPTTVQISLTTKNRLSRFKSEIISFLNLDSVRGVGGRRYEHWARGYDVFIPGLAGTILIFQWSWTGTTHKKQVQERFCTYLVLNSRVLLLFTGSYLVPNLSIWEFPFLSGSGWHEWNSIWWWDTPDGHSGQCCVNLCVMYTLDGSCIIFNFFNSL